MGKGLIGVVARPLGGLTDFVFYTIYGIHHHTLADDGVLFLRYPRFIQPDKILRPFNYRQAEGKYYLNQVPPTSNV